MGLSVLKGLLFDTLFDYVRSCLSYSNVTIATEGTWELSRMAVTSTVYLNIMFLSTGLLTPLGLQLKIHFPEFHHVISQFVSVVIHDELPSPFLEHPEEKDQQFKTQRLRQ